MSAPVAGAAGSPSDRPAAGDTASGAGAERLARPPSDASTARRWLRLLAPYAITALVVAGLLQRYELSRILAEMRQGSVLPMAAVALSLSFVLLPMTALWDRAVIRAAVPPGSTRPRYLDVVRGRAGSAVLMAVNYAAGSGGFGVWIARVTGCGPSVGASIVLYIVTSDLAAVALVATPAAWMATLDVPVLPALRVGAPAVAALVVGMALLGPRIWGRQTSPDLRDRPRVPWAVAGPAAALTSIVGRCVNIVVILVATWLGAGAFGMPLPFSAVAIYMPVILLIGSLPINVLGVGAVTGIWALAFERFAPGERVLAFQFLWSLFFGTGVVLRGLPFVRRVVAEIDEGKKQQAAESPPERAPRE